MPEKTRPVIGSILSLLAATLSTSCSDSFSEKQIIGKWEDKNVQTYEYENGETMTLETNSTAGDDVVIFEVKGEDEKVYFATKSRAYKQRKGQIITIIELLKGLLLY